MSLAHRSSKNNFDLASIAITTWSYARIQRFQEKIADDLTELPEYLKRERSVRLWTDEYTNLTRLLR
ncbi:MAG: hypothetical protein ACK6AT_08995 [Planctomycetota bacterium]|jgi:hypothetical protein